MKHINGKVLGHKNDRTIYCFALNLFPLSHAAIDNKITTDIITYIIAFSITTYFLFFKLDIMRIIATSPKIATPIITGNHSLIETTYKSFIFYLQTCITYFIFYIAR